MPGKNDWELEQDIHDAWQRDDEASALIIENERDEPGIFTFEEMEEYGLEEESDEDAE